MPSLMSQTGIRREGAPEKKGNVDLGAEVESAIAGFQEAVSLGNTQGQDE